MRETGRTGVWKRMAWLTVAVAVLLAMAMAPLQAMAAGEKTVASGSCGKEVKWKLSESGVLTISGKGPMQDYSYAKDPPWKKHLSSVRAVVIQSGVTSIGEHAFEEPDVGKITAGLVRLEIPKSVTTIGEYAFCGCENLEVDGAQIHSGIKKIGANAFMQVTIKKLKLNKNMELEDCAFQSIKGLEYVEIPEGFTKILGWFGNCEDLKGIKIPSTATSIEAYAFHNTGIEEAIIPSNVKSIGYGAFSNCHKLKNVVISGGVKAIPGAAFESCPIESITLPSTVTSVGDEAFSACESTLKHIYYGGTKAQWKRIKVTNPDENRALKKAKLHYACEIKAVSSKGGHVIGGDVKKKGESVTIQAKPAKGYYFAGWKDGKKTVSTSQKYTFKASKSRTLKAAFAKLATPKLTAKAGRKGSVKLTFPKVSGATEYEIYYGASSKKMEKIASVKPGKGKTVSYTDKGRKPGKACCYKVRAVSKGKVATTYGAYSKTKTVKAKK